MNILDSNNIHECTSCQVCALLCTQNAISYSIDSNGFYRPIVDENKCVDCGLCKKVCYKYTEIEPFVFDEHVYHYAAAATDENILKNTTSGGISDVLCEQLIKDGYKCVGVAYDCQNDTAIGKIATNREDTYSFRGSKYIQSYSYPAFNQIFNAYKSEKIAIFGTPCQIYAIDKYLKRKGIRDNCLLIDIYCHGCPSMLLWKKYISQIKKEKKIQQFNYISFRDKSNGWGQYHIKGLDMSQNTYHSPKINDKFFTLFFSNLLLNDACYTCEIRNSLNHTDIRLGDFWGKHYLHNTSGMSLVSINPASDRGKKIFEIIKTTITSKKHNTQDCIPYQSVNLTYTIDCTLRSELIQSLADNNAALSDCTSLLWKNYSFKQKCFHFIKNIVLLMPNSVIACIKSLCS